MKPTVFVLSRGGYFYEAEAGVSEEDVVAEIINGDIEPAKVFRIAPSSVVNISADIAHLVVVCAERRGAGLTDEAFSFCEMYGAVPAGVVSMNDGRFDYVWEGSDE